jgi:hypothetical protein
MINGGKVVGYKIVVFKKGIDRAYGLSGTNMKGTNSIQSGRILTGIILSQKVTNGDTNVLAATECTRLAASSTLTNDWYLPSSEELQVLLTNLSDALVNTLDAGDYWSSTPTTLATLAIAVNNPLANEALSNRNTLNKVVCLRDVYI